MAKAWTDSENEEIVRAYFVMLEHEQMGRSFVKAEHKRELMEAIGRSSSSIEYKHKTISAVLENLGLPYISGYSPLGNGQRALVETVRAQLNKGPKLYSLLIGEAGTLPDRSVESIVFDKAPPQRKTSEQGKSNDTENTNSRFVHRAERDAQNRELGKKGESLVYKYEKRRLQELGRTDLSEQVRWVARDDGDGYGYDIRSFSGEGEDANKELLLEVKTTNGSATTPFYLTLNELRVSKEHADTFRVFRLYDFRKQVRAFCLDPPLERHVSLTPTIYRAFF